MAASEVVEDDHPYEVFSNYAEADEFVHQYQVDNGYTFIKQKKTGDPEPEEPLELGNKKIFVIGGMCGVYQARELRVCRHSALRMNRKIKKEFKDAKLETAITGCQAQIVIQTCVKFPGYTLYPATDTKFHRNQLISKFRLGFEASTRHKLEVRVIFLGQHSNHDETKVRYRRRVRQTEVVNTVQEEETSPTAEYQCSVCSMRLSTKHGLEKHKFCHTGEKPHVCNYCGARFAVREYLMNHMKGHSNEKLFTCQICGRSFARKTTLNAHIGTHSEDKKFGCAKCDKTFTTKANRDYHQKAHCERQIHTCELCYKSFTSASYLKFHKKAHLGITAYRCEECGKDFTTRRIYEEHLWRHKGEKRFQCGICPQRYYSQRELKVHMAFHNTETTFKCHRCQMFFQSDRSLQNHISKLHQTLVSCGFCAEEFVNKRFLKAHIFQNHRELAAKRAKMPKEMRALFKSALCALCGRVLCNKYRLREHLLVKHSLNKQEVEEIERTRTQEPVYEVGGEVIQEVSDVGQEEMDVDSVGEEIVENKDLENAEPPAVVDTAALDDSGGLGEATEANVDASNVQAQASEGPRTTSETTAVDGSDAAEKTTETDVSSLNDPVEMFRAVPVVTKTAATASAVSDKTTEAVVGSLKLSVRVPEVSQEVTKTVAVASSNSPDEAAKAAAETFNVQVEMHKAPPVATKTDGTYASDVLEANEDYVESFNVQVEMHEAPSDVKKTDDEDTSNVALEVPKVCPVFTKTASTGISNVAREAPKANTVFAKTADVGTSNVPVVEVPEAPVEDVTDSMIQKVADASEVEDYDLEIIENGKEQIVVILNVTEDPGIMFSSNQDYEILSGDTEDLPGTRYITKSGEHVIVMTDEQVNDPATSETKNENAVMSTNLSCNVGNVSDANGRREATNNNQVSVDEAYPVADTTEDFEKFENAIRLKIDSLKDYNGYEEFLNKMIITLQYAKYKHWQKAGDT